MFLQPSIVIGNLLIKLIRKEIFQVSFFDIYNFFYYVHEYLSYNSTATMIMGSRDNITEFVESYNQYISLAGERIEIINANNLIELLTSRYTLSIDMYNDSFNYAFSKMKI